MKALILSRSFRSDIRTGYFNWKIYMTTFILEIRSLSGFSDIAGLHIGSIQILVPDQTKDQVLTFVFVSYSILKRMFFTTSKILLGIILCTSKIKANRNFNQQFACMLVLISSPAYGKVQLHVQQTNQIFTFTCPRKQLIPVGDNII